MDTKKTLMRPLAAMLLTLISAVCCMARADVASVQFCDRMYEYGIGNEEITLFVNFLDPDGQRIQDVDRDKFNQFFSLSENGVKIEADRLTLKQLDSGVRIPREYTFSILLDYNIPAEGKKKIMDIVETFAASAPDSCVYVSFYGSGVSEALMANKDNLPLIREQFMSGERGGKAFYSGVYAKLMDFSPESASDAEYINPSGYTANREIANRARLNPDKNILIVFAEGSKTPDIEELDFDIVTSYQTANTETMPRVYAFYYVERGKDPDIEITLQGISQPRIKGKAITSLQGIYRSCESMNDVLNQFQTAAEESMYDYAISYTADPSQVYTGTVDFIAFWGNAEVGSAKYTIGSAEKPWPQREQSTVSIITELIIAILVTALTFAFFLFVMKIIVPYIRFVTFRHKYYRRYEAEPNVSRRICHYCKQEIRPGQMIVARCSHLMHEHCWKENGYKCSEFGQNCKTGIQQHVELSDLFTRTTLADCSQTISGIIAGLISWVVYELCGRGGFEPIAKAIVGLVFSGEQTPIVADCVVRTSSFLMIGLLLGFFISLVFRYKDDVRDKSFMIWLKIIGLSLLTALIGMAAFAVGADIFCLILSWTGKSYIPWYCSLPAYILFSLAVSLALTIKSTIPVKSALLGGLCASVIGFLVLYFTKFTHAGYEWLNMLLDFIIYGGGLGASLITVRMLAERYFLVIQNGVKAGQRIPIHKWMNATGGGNKVSIGMTGDCEIQMNWEKSNKVAKEHATLYVDTERHLPVIKPLAAGVIYNSRATLPVNKAAVLANGDTFKIGDTIFKYEEA